jgi:hypothetical protein
MARVDARDGARFEARLERPLANVDTARMTDNLTAVCEPIV